MNSWRKEPPTYREWGDMDNHGCWWVKFILTHEEIDEDEDGNPICWPETWFTDVVFISVSYDEGTMHLDDNDGAHLHARGYIIGKFDLDDKEATKDLYWQPVEPPKNDLFNKRPEVD